MRLVGELSGREKDQLNDFVHFRIVDPCPGVVLGVIVLLFSGVEKHLGNGASRKPEMIAARKPILWIARVRLEIKLQTG